MLPLTALVLLDLLLFFTHSRGTFPAIRPASLTSVVTATELAELLPIGAVNSKGDALYIYQAQRDLQPVLQQDPDYFKHEVIASPNMHTSDLHSESSSWALLYGPLILCSSSELPIESPRAPNARREALDL